MSQHGPGARPARLSAGQIGCLALIGLIVLLWAFGTMSSDSPARQQARERAQSYFRRAVEEARARSFSSFMSIIAFGEFDDVHVLVSEEWYNLTQRQKERMAEAAGDVWRTAYAQAGAPDDQGVVELRDSSGNTVAWASGRGLAEVKRWWSEQLLDRPGPLSRDRRTDRGWKTITPAAVGKFPLDLMLLQVSVGEAASASNPGREGRLAAAGERQRPIELQGGADEIWGKNPGENRRTPVARRQVQK
jgi:hypothetical protein